MIPAGLSNLQQRLVSALVLAAVVLVTTLVGGWLFRVLVCLVAIAVFLEWLAMAKGNIRPVRPVAITAFVAATLPLILGFGPSSAIFVGLVLGAVAAVLAESHGHGIWTARGFAYSFLPAFALIMLREGGGTGVVAVLFLYAVVWATDVGAYFTGRALGGPRLAPTISPGKTWSGALGGLAAGVVAGLVVAASAGSDLSGALMTAILLSIAAQIGDLFESSIKRQANVKDSSQLIPGHGGAMDRIDGLAFAAVALYLLGVIGGYPGAPAAGLY